MRLFWSTRRQIVEWLAAEYRDREMMPPDDALQRAEADFRQDPVDASNRSAAFAGMVLALTGCRDPRRVGNRPTG